MQTSSFVLPENKFNYSDIDFSPIYYDYTAFIHR